MTDFRGDLSDITVPTLVVHGDGDAIVPFEGSGARTHRATGHSSLVVIPGPPAAATSVMQRSSTKLSSSSRAADTIRKDVPARPDGDRQRDLQVRF